ncbi:MAG: beta-ketoacyl-[acyl-carrier-protein] synthase family protein [Verrucomicrobiota bacterium]
MVVTGFGVLAANGIGSIVFWKTLLAGKSGIGPITLFDATTFPIRIAGEVKDFDLTRLVSGIAKPKRLGRHTQLALAAFQQALQHAQLSREILAAHAPVPIVVGVSTSAIEVIERGKDQMTAHGPSKVSSYIVSACQPHAVATALAEIVGVPAQVETTSTACPAGLNAINIAYQLVKSGKTELAIAGGADAPITPLTVASFGATGMVPDWNDSPQKASRPFDRDRRGGILAEGAAFVVLENLEYALARGMNPYLEILGYGNSTDAPGTEPCSGLDASMAMALANSARSAGDVDCVFAHGPSDPVIDRMETEAIKKVLGPRAYDIPVTSIKGVTGNPLAAAGPLQLISAALAVRDGLVPPTANYEHRDPACDLDFVPGRARSTEINTALMNVHGLGGVNGSMVAQRVNGA